MIEDVVVVTTEADAIAATHVIVNVVAVTVAAPVVAVV